MLSCPNKRLKVWKTLVANVGEPKAYLLWAEYEGNVPDKFYEPSRKKEGIFTAFGDDNTFITDEMYTPELVRSHPDYIFLFGDNLEKKGKGGQAIIRDEPNTFGIPTKLAPRRDDAAFMTDATYEENKEAIDRAMEKLYDLNMADKKNIVFPKGGFGTGLAALEEKAPRTYAYLRGLLIDYFRFDNDTGTFTSSETLYNVRETTQVIPMSFYDVAFSQPYKEDNTIKSLGAFNATDGIRVKSHITKEAFMEHISGKGNERGSKQKKIVFDSLINDYGYDEREISDFFETEEDIKAFIIFHEISHLEHNDTEKSKNASANIYAKAIKEEGLSEEKAMEKALSDERLYHPIVIEFETRATIDAFNSMRIVKDKHRRFVKNIVNEIMEDPGAYEEGLIDNVEMNVFSDYYSPEEFRKFLGKLSNDGQLGFDFGNNPCK